MFCVCLGLALYPWAVSLCVRLYCVLRLFLCWCSAVGMCILVCVHLLLFSDCCACMYICVDWCLCTVRCLSVISSTSMYMISIVFSVSVSASAYANVLKISSMLISFLCLFIFRIRGFCFLFPGICLLSRLRR